MKKKQKKIPSRVCVFVVTTCTHTQRIHFKINGGIHQKLYLLKIDHPNAKYSRQTRFNFKTGANAISTKFNKHTQTIYNRINENYCSLPCIAL